MAKQTAIEWLQVAGVNTSALEEKFKQLGDSHAEKRDSDGKVVAPAQAPARSVVEGIARQFVNDNAVSALIAEIVDEALDAFAAHPGVDYPKPAVVAAPVAQ